VFVARRGRSVEVVGAEAEAAGCAQYVSAVLSDEQLLVAIFQFLPCEDLVCAGLVCRQVQQLHPHPLDRNRSLVLTCTLLLANARAIAVERGVSGAGAVAKAVLAVAPALA
jgi:hypothetical protein